MLFFFIAHAIQFFSDPFLRSMASWLIKDYNGALEILLVPLQNVNSEINYGYPSIFNFYHYLRSHPLLRRSYYVKHRSHQNQHMTLLNENTNENNTFRDEAKRYERKLYFQTAVTHLNAGLPGIAFEVLSMLPQYNDLLEESIEECEDLSFQHNSSSKDNEMINTGTISFEYEKSKSSLNKNEDNFGSWGISGSNGMATNRFADLEEYTCGIDLSSYSDSDEETKYEEIEKIDKTIDNNDRFDADEVDSSVHKDRGSNAFDIIALNLKYMCLIQCIIEQLKALPVKCSQENTKLRSSLSFVLREELDFLHKCCDYGQNDGEEEVNPVDVEKDIMEQEIQSKFLIKVARQYLAD